MPRLDITGGYGGSGFASLIHSCLINKSLRRSSSLISPSSLSSRVYGAFMEELENLTLAIFAQKELVFAPPPFVSDLFCDESTVTKLVQQAMQSIIIITKAIGECDFVLELDISEGTQQSPPLPQSVPQSPGLVTTAAGCKRNWQEMDDVLDNEFDDSCELEYNLTAFVDIPHEVARHDPTTSPVLLRSASTAASTTAKKPRPNLNNILSLHPRITTPPRPVTIKSSLMDFMRLRNNLKQTLPAPFRQKTITSTCPLVASTGTPLITARTTPVVNTKPMILMGNSAITRRNMVPSPRSPIRPSFATTCAIAPPPPTILSPPTLTHSHLIVCDLPFFSRDYASRRIVRLLESKFNIELVERNLSKQYDRYSSAAAAANGGGTITTASDRKGDTTTPCSPPNLFVFAPDLVLNEASCVV